MGEESKSEAVAGGPQEAHATKPAGLGALYAALAKAQVEFPPIPRTRTVTVRSEKGNYTFDYAPLDTILAVCRPILGKHALALTQSWNADALVTTLGHESGAELRSSIPVPQAESMQKRGAALSYLRRYSIQALLGVASEEDTDGDADGTQSVVPRRVERKAAPPSPAKEAKAVSAPPDEGPTEFDLLRESRERLNQQWADAADDDARKKVKFGLGEWVKEINVLKNKGKLQAKDVDVLRALHTTLSSAETGAHAA